MIGLYFAIIILTCYLIGNINFAKIVVGLFKREDITKKGSGNPGTMNVVRNYGIGMGLLVFILEAAKAGVPAIVCATLMQGYGIYDLVFFVAGASVILGQVFPVVTKFKGGKGIACTAGLFFFTPWWWIALIVFILCALFLYLFDIAFLASLLFVTIMTIILIIMYATASVEYLWIVLLLLSLIWLFAIVNHRSNFKRLFEKRENKSGFRHKILMAFSKKYREYIKQEENKELRKREAVKKFLEEKEQAKEVKKEEKELVRQEKKQEKANEKIEKVARKSEKKARKKSNKSKKKDGRVKRTRNGKRNPFKHNRKKKIEKN